MTNKEKYRQLCRTETSICIFSQDWWLDAVVGDQNWDVAIHEENSNILGTWPYYLKQKAGFNIITVPHLTKYLGIWLSSETQNFSTYKKTIEALHLQLPKTTSFTQLFSPDFTNWLPLYWLGYKQTTRYTYTLPGVIDFADIEKKIDKRKQEEIKKAQKILSIKTENNIDAFYQQRICDLEKKGDKISYSFPLLEAIYKACNAKNACQIISCKDQNQQTYATGLVIWDHQTMYFLICSINPDYKNSGASALLTKEVIRLAAEKKLNLDFEAGMNQNSEKFYRTFSPQLTPYFEISKDTHLLFKIKRLFSI